MPSERKPKVTRPSLTLAQQIEKLQGQLNLTSLEQLAERVGVSRPRVSEWRAEKAKPTPENFLTMGILARDADLRRWFLEQSGFDVAALLLASGKESERPLGALTGALAAPIPTGAEAFTVPEGMAGPFPPGDVFIIEPAADPHDPRPFWDQVVLMNFPPEQRPAQDWFADRWPKGLYIGRLRCKAYTVGVEPTLTYFATIGPVNDSATRWHGSIDAFPVGGWTHPGPSKEPVPGSPREKAAKEYADASARYRAGHDEEAAKRGDVFIRSAQLEALAKAESEARNRLTHEEQDDARKAEEEAESQARGMISLHQGARIVGRVIASFAAPKGKE